MFPTYNLEWFFKGQWQTIGWPAATPDSLADLESHGEALASRGGKYRLVVASPYLDGTPTVIREYGECRV